MTGISAYSVTPRQARKHVIRAISVGLVPFIKASPGTGKSAIVRSIAEEYNLELIDHRLSTSAPEDLSGLPHFKDGKSSFLPFDIFPMVDTPKPANKQGWLLFLDEFNSASKAVQAAAYKLILDKMVGQAKLNPLVAIVCAGNLATDRAIVNNIGTAMQSRIITLNMDVDHTEFMEDVAFKQKWDSRIIAYLSYKPGQLHDFKPDHNENTFCAPRTWEFMNKLITGHPVVVEDAALYAGAITSGVAVDFITFTKVFDSIPKIADVVKSPNVVAVPIDGATRFATITHLIEHAIEDNFDPITVYINRFPAEFRVLFFRALTIQKPELRKHQAFREAMVTLSRYLNDDLPAAAA